MSSYTKARLLDRINTASKNMTQFYKESFVNYRGKTSDTKEYYTEIIAAWCLNNINKFLEIPQITRKASYRTPGHDGKIANPDSGREEELIAMKMFRQEQLPVIGKILDYQTPLKNRSADKAGKIDLLAWDDSTLRILELKRQNSKDTMLRCVLEGYTYLQIIDKQKLLNDFGLTDFEKSQEIKVTSCPLVSTEGLQQQELNGEHPQLLLLMNALGIETFFYSESGCEDQKYMIYEKMPR